MRGFDLDVGVGVERGIGRWEFLRLFWFLRNDELERVEGDLVS